MFFYLGVMLPLWSSYLVKIYAWKLILAKEGIPDLAGDQAEPVSGWSDAWLSLPVIGGDSLPGQLMPARSSSSSTCLDAVR